MTPHPDEQARELAEWLHEKLCCAQNLPWEKGDICDDCLESVKTEVLPILARVREEERAKLSRVPQRFWSKIEITDKCWNWLADLNRGYGVFWSNGKHVKAHRFIYERLIGPIPEGKTIDHLCRNTRCVNPAHLEPVTMSENVLRGFSDPAINGRKTHCKHGHAFTPENTFISVWGKKKQRRCRTCDKARESCRPKRVRNAPINGARRIR